MNILYIGELNEIGAALVNHLSMYDDVAVCSAQKSDYEIDCEIIAPDADIDAVIRDKKTDVILCPESPDARIGDIERILSLAAKNDGCRLVYLRETPFFRRRKQDADAVGLMCEGLAKQHGVKTVLVQTSGLYSRGRIPAYPADALRQISRHNELTPGGAADEFCDCMHIEDFCAAVESILHHNPENDFETVELQSAYPFLLSAFVDKLSERYTQITVLDYAGAREQRDYTPYQSDDWSPKHSFIEDLPTLLDDAETRETQLNKSKRKKLAGTALTIGVFLLVFFFVEMYTRFIAVSSDLQFVDMRLLFVVGAALLLGKRYGIGAACLCSIASVTQSIISGYRWYVLFYHVDNWIPIAVYFIAAILLGLYRDKLKNNDIS